MSDLTSNLNSAPSVSLGLAMETHNVTIFLMALSNSI